MSNIQQGKRLRNAREALINPETGEYYTQTEFGLEINLTRETVSKWENRDELPKKLIKLVKTVFNINPDYIVKGEEPMFLPPKVHILQSKPATLGIEGRGEISGGYPPGEEPAPSNNREKIKHLRGQVAETIKKTTTHPGIRLWAVAGAGNPFTVDPAQDEPLEIIRPEFMVSPRFRDAFRIAGNSMEPVIHDRALVFCDFNDKVPKSGNIYAFDITGEGLIVKELRSEKQENAPMRWVIYSYNEQYNPLYYSDAELKESNCIIGRIILIHQELERKGVIARPAISAHSEERE